jgi:hypothetical protein
MIDKLKYIGSKLYVSHKGISFGTSIDKYNYLQEIVLILDAIRAVEDSYKVQVSTVLNITDDEILSKVVTTDKAKKELEERMSYYKKKIESEAKDVDRLQLSDIEKSVFKENLRLTADDRLQRAFNKSIYHIALNEICRIIFAKKIRVIKTPYTPDFNHIIYSIRNTLRANQPTLEVKRDYILDNSRAQIVLKNNFTI